MKQQAEPAYEAMRQRLSAAIARKDAERGRPLTDRERLDNIARMIQEIDPK